MVVKCGCLVSGSVWLWSFGCAQYVGVGLWCEGLRHACGIVAPAVGACGVVALVW